MFHQKRSFYPLAIAVLTLGLGSLMFLTLNRTSVAPSADPTAVSPTPAVTDAEYRAQAHDVIAPFRVAYASADSDGSRLAAVEDALSALVRIVVPGSYKDVHLGLAVSLTQIREGLRGDASALAAGNDRLNGIVANEPWLSP